MHDEDIELQIELTRLQIKHEHRISAYTIGISVVLSLAFTNLSIYVPLGVQTGNLLYTIVGVAYAVVIVPIFYHFLNKMRRVEAQLEEDIRKLKEKYLWY